MFYHRGIILINIITNLYNYQERAKALSLQDYYNYCPGGTIELEKNYSELNFVSKRINKNVRINLIPRKESDNIIRIEYDGDLNQEDIDEYYIDSEDDIVSSHTDNNDFEYYFEPEGELEFSRYPFNHLILNFPISSELLPEDKINPFILKFNGQVESLTLNFADIPSYNSFNHGLIVNDEDCKDLILTSNVSHLTLNNYRGSFEFLPSSLISLSGEINKPLNVDHLRFINNLQVLRLNYFPSSGYFKLDLSRFNNLKILDLSDGFEILKFPPYLLKFNSTNFSYHGKPFKRSGINDFEKNNIFRIEDLPDSLLSLKLNRYSDDIKILPPNLIKFYLQHGYGFNSNYRIKTITYLPSSLQKLKVNKSYQIETPLPNSLKELYIGKSYLHKPYPDQNDDKNNIENNGNEENNDLNSLEILILDYMDITPFLKSNYPSLKRLTILFEIDSAPFNIREIDLSQYQKLRSWSFIYYNYYSNVGRMIKEFEKINIVYPLSLIHLEIFPYFPQLKLPPNLQILSTLGFLQFPQDSNDPFYIELDKQLPPTLKIFIVKIGQFETILDGYNTLKFFLNQRGIELSFGKRN